MRRALPTTAYILLGLPLGIVWFTLLVTGFSLGLGMLLTFVGVFVLAATWEAARVATGLEARLANVLLDARCAPVAPVRGLRGRATDPAGWRGATFLLSRFVLGIPLFAVVAALVLNGAGLLVGPLWFWAPDDGISLGTWRVDTLPEALLGVPVGAVLLGLGLWMAAAATGPLRALAEWGMPGAGASRVAAGRARAPRTVTPVDWVAGLRTATSVALGAEGIMLVVWLATGAGYPWPLWPAIGLALPVGVTAIGVWKARVPAGRLRRLAVHAALCGLLLGVCVLLWFAAAVGDGVLGSFWPGWVAFGLAITLLLHAAVPERASRELQERLARVEASRAASVDARDDELGRIERDLHDGAQARLVAVALGLGRAEERLDADPTRARELMLEAQQQAQAAIRELRDLARGIAPPVLTDRGLVAAVDALAARSPVDVVVRDRLNGRRPPAPVERTAYFVVAEAITNAAKHAGPEATVVVDLDTAKHRLAVRVLDDGPGDADAAGSGLQGLAQRVEAVDGAFSVDSEPGQGTLVSALLPWPGAVAS